MRSSLTTALGPSDRLVLSAITSRAALARPVRTVSSRSKPSPTLIGVLADAATRTTSFWTTTASPTRVCADEGVIPAPATRPIASNTRTQFRETISHRTIDATIFLAAHFALLVGLTTPESFIFDEVHYVPAARQMLEPVMPQPMLNPMHPPLAKQLSALSISAFGDGPFAWRYPSVLFGSLSIVAIYLCGLALFAAQGPAVASALLAFFNQMVFVQSRIAMLDIYSLAFSLLGIAAFMHGFRQRRPQHAFALAGLAFGFSAACKWSGLFPLAVSLLVVGVIRLLQGWRTQFGDAKAD